MKPSRLKENLEGYPVKTRRPDKLKENLEGYPVKTRRPHKLEENLVGQIITRFSRFVQARMKPSRFSYFQGFERLPFGNNLQDLNDNVKK